MFAGNYRDSTGKSECRDFKFMRIACTLYNTILRIPRNFPETRENIKISEIAGIHAIPINLKSLHSDFPVESL